VSFFVIIIYQVSFFVGKLYAWTNFARKIGKCIFKCFCVRCICCIVLITNVAVFVCYCTRCLAVFTSFCFVCSEVMASNFFEAFFVVATKFTIKCIACCCYAVAFVFYKTFFFRNVFTYVTTYFAVV
jgi:hypothetical protein